MLLTRKATSEAVPQARLSRGLPASRTMDRRAFLRRSGVTLGAGAASIAAASQLPFSMIGEAQAKAEEGKVEVKRSV